MATIVLTDALKLANEFLSRIQAPRAPWLRLFEAFAVEKRLTESDARAVRLTILRLRVYGVTEKTRRRR